MILKYLFLRIYKMPIYIMYRVYDYLWYIVTKAKLIFYGWGIHLYTGKFGAGKTSLMVIKAYKLCKHFPQLSVLTNINLRNFPAHTRIYHLNNAVDILNAPKNCLILIDEIGTIFNSRDFSRGDMAVPKPVYQHLCQCRKRKLMIFATVQRYVHLDKQIRDITADVTECASYPDHPFTRLLVGRRYDIEDYDILVSSPTYTPKMLGVDVYVQREMYRSLYDTSELVSGLLKKKYLTDEEIVQNQGIVPEFNSVIDRKTSKRIRRRTAG